MDLLLVFFKIWILLVVSIFIFVELEKDFKNTKKPITSDQKNVSHQGDVWDSIQNVPGLPNKKTSINPIVKIVFSTNWDGCEQLNYIVDLIRQNYNFSSYQLNHNNTNSVRFNAGEQYPLVVDLSRAGFNFPIDILLKYNNPACEHGWTVAHEMAKQNHMFSVEELELLGNPTDIRGLTISDIMILNGHQFSEIEKHRLGIDYQEFNYTSYATYPENIYQNYNREDLSKTCIKCGGEFFTTNLPHIIHNNEDFYSLKLYSCTNCHWWFLYEDRMKNDADYRNFNVLFIGVPKLIKPGSAKDQKPWEKILPDGLIYHHRLKDNTDISSLFPPKKEAGQST